MGQGSGFAGLHRDTECAGVIRAIDTKMDSKRPSMDTRMDTRNDARGCPRTGFSLLIYLCARGVRVGLAQRAWAVLQGVGV